MVGGVTHCPGVPEHTTAVLVRPAATSFFFNDTATTEIYTLPLHDALPILPPALTEATPSLLVIDRSATGFTVSVSVSLLLTSELSSLPHVASMVALVETLPLLAVTVDVTVN